MIRDAFSLAVRMISPIVYRLDKMVEVRRFVRNFRKGGGGVRVILRRMRGRTKLHCSTNFRDDDHFRSVP